MKNEKTAGQNDNTPLYARRVSAVSDAKKRETPWYMRANCGHSHSGAWFCCFRLLHAIIVAETMRATAAATNKPNPIYSPRAIDGSNVDTSRRQTRQYRRLPQQARLSFPSSARAIAQHRTIQEQTATEAHTSTRNAPIPHLPQHAPRRIPFHQDRLHYCPWRHQERHSPN